MAPRNITAWIPIEYDPNLVTQQAQSSAIERLASLKPMGSDTMEMPRLLGADVGGGSQLVEDTNDGSKVTMYSYQYNGKQTLDEADTEDAYVDAVAGYNFQWLNKFHLSYDNASLGVSGARSSTETDYRPYDSLLRVLTQADSAAGYVANANVKSGAATYDLLSDTLGLLEDSDFGGDVSQLVVIAHRGLRNTLRKIKDTANNPIFQLGIGGSAIDDETLFGLPIAWTAGAVESTSFKMVSTGPKLLFVANRNAIVHGRRVDPQARFIPASINTTALEHTLQYRARKGFVCTVPQAAAVLRVTP